MEIHHGEVIEMIIRKKGLGVTEVARLSHVNRRTVYNWFSQKYLKSEIIYQLGVAIKHDFSIEFPELFSTDDFKSQQNEPAGNHVAITSGESAGDQVWKDRYIGLLEDYNKLLLLLKALENHS